MKPARLLNLCPYLLLLLFTGMRCSSAPVDKYNGDYSDRIESKEMFETLEGAPLSDKYSDNTAVKVMYDVHAKKIYFIASSKYKYHYDFATEVLGVMYSLDVFNQSSYGPGERRKYIVATIDHFAKPDIYAIEFVGSDLSDAAEIKEFFDVVAERCYFGNALKLLVNTSHLIDLENAGLLQMSLIHPDAVFGNQQYQPVNEGLAYGYLRRLHDVRNAIDSVGEHDIVIITQNPLDMPVCQGIITTQFQTPLSHINILSHNRGTVCFAYTNADQDQVLQSMENKLVSILVYGDRYIIEPATIDRAVKVWEKQGNNKKIRLTADLTVDHLIDVKDLNRHTVNVVGSKAANFGELQKIQTLGNFKTPEGAFAIPFYYFDQHVHQAAVDSLLQRLFSDTSLQHNNAALDEHLKKIRKAIKKAPLDPQLLAEVEAKIRAADAGTAYRFRSSTNAEDIKGFNGAGLYDSKTGILDDTSKSIEDAIREVWSSVYTFSAYAERRHFNIDETTVHMGLLVHRGFPDETANGVAITTNLYRRDFPGFVINVQRGEISVVAPGDSIICDQFIVYNTLELGDRGNHVVSDYLTFSNQNNGKPVLSQSQIEQLYDALSQVKSHFYSQDHSLTDYPSFALDIEFKFDGDKGLYIKQVRPY